MPSCKIFLLTPSHMPTNQHQFLDDIFIFVTCKNWCLLAGKWLHVSKKILQLWYFFIMLCYILIFWAQKGWFIELNLWLGSEVVCWWRVFSRCLSRYLFFSEGSYWLSKNLSNKQVLLHYFFIYSPDFCEKNGKILITHLHVKLLTDMIWNGFYFIFLNLRQQF